MNTTVSLNGAGRRATGAARLRSLILDTPITSKVLIYIELIYVLTVFFIVNSLGAPYAAIYILDLLNAAAVLCSLKKAKSVFHYVQYGAVLWVFFAFCALLTLSDVLNAVSFPLVVWAFRNTFRLFGFFMACVTLLDMGDVERIMKVFYVFQILNVFVSLFQFYALGLRQDNLGGIFGSAAGCNGYSNIFFCMLLCYYAMFCLSGKKPVKYLIIICCSTLVLAAMAEIKFFFFEFSIIMMVAVVAYVQKVRAFVVAALSVIALLVGLQVFASVFPDSYKSLFDAKAMTDYSTKGMAGYELSRFGAFGEINQLIFNNDPVKELFGVGFGGAEMSSSIPMFNSDFYYQWGYLNYRWFSHQMWYIETGLVGFLLFVSLFVGHFLYTVRLVARCPKCKVLLQFVALFTLVTIVNLWYNCSTRIEAGYIIYFALSISCIVAKPLFNQGVERRILGAS